MVWHKGKKFQSISIDAAVRGITELDLATSDILKRKTKASVRVAH